MKDQSNLLKNLEFKQAWGNYHYYATINDEPNYKIDVYKLNNEVKK
jgi:hypothetical protein